MMNKEEKIVMLNGAIKMVESDATAKKEVVSVVQDSIEGYARCMELDEAFMEALWFADRSAEDGELEERDEEERTEIIKQTDISKLLQKHPDFLGNIDNEYKLTAIQFWNFDFRICTEKDRESADWVRVTYRNCDGEICLYENASPLSAARHLSSIHYDGMPMLTDKILEAKVGKNSLAVKSFKKFVESFGM